MVGHWIQYSIKGTNPVLKRDTVKMHTFKFQFPKIMAQQHLIFKNGLPTPDTNLGGIMGVRQTNLKDKVNKSLI